MKQAETTYAKVAPCVVRTAGLFCKASSCEPGWPLDVSREIEGLLYRFTAPMQLTERDLEVLLALTAIGCSQDGTFQTTRQFSGPDAATRARKQLSAKVEIRTSYSTLARELGRSAGGDTWPHISQALARLFAVSVYVKPSSVVNWHRYSAGHLLDALTADIAGDTIAVSLSPVLASAVLGGRGEFIRVPMEEVRELRADRSGITRLLHFHLHGRPAGETCSITEGRLMSLIFGSDAAQGSTLRMRTSALRKAMVRLGLLPGWKTSRNGATHYVRRPKSARSSSQEAEH